MDRDMYFSVDIETDGPAPGVCSMLSIGAVALDPVTGQPFGEFYRTLKRLPEARPDNKTMEWWDGFPVQWAETRAGAVEPGLAMKDFHAWVIDQGKLAKRMHGMDKGPIPVFAALPAGFDYSFVYYYLHRFVGECVFGFSALDIKSLGMGMLNTGFTTPTRETNPPEWESPLPHTHNALDDARQQADQLCRMLEWRAKYVLFAPTGGSET